MRPARVTDRILDKAGPFGLYVESLGGIVDLALAGSRGEKPKGASPEGRSSTPKPEERQDAMSWQTPLDRCVSYIDCRLQEDGAEPPHPAKPRPSIAISRQAGTGGIPVAEKLAEYLETHEPAHDCPWTVFDKNLVEKVLEDHNLPKRLARFMPEDHVSQLEDMMEELLGLHPPSWTLVRQMTETVLRLARLGNVILVGHGANVITARLDNVFQVRLVGTLEPRTRFVERFYHLDRESAVEFIRREDRGRKRYVRKHFHQDVEDPVLYHLIINTDRFSFGEAARLIGEAVRQKFYAQPMAAEASRALV
jgi:cytidylate kinase